MMAKRATSYPQVEIGAAGLVNASLVAVPASVSIAEALATSRRRDVQGLVAGDAVILREDLARAASLGVGGARARALARPLPVVDGRATEVVVRRHLAAGAPLVVVRDGRRVLGGVRAAGSAAPGISVADRLAARLPDATRGVLATAARIAPQRGARAYLAGGVVRDALAGHGDLGSPDLDLVVEGDGPGVARALADALAAPVIEHARFLTATVGPTPAGRVDVATARSERYDGRGTLPRVMPSSIEQDLRRRDFTVNAMAVELASGGYGLLDPYGGRGDLAAGRLRILHPASFVEDPTRIFRAARYAARLGLRLDPWTSACQAWALSLVPYPALSGPRILAELAHILADRSPEIVLVRLGVAGAFRLLDSRYRFGRVTRARVAALPPTLAWSRAHGLDVAPVELLLVAVLAEQGAAVVSSALRRLDVSGEPFARLTRAITEGPALADAVVHAARASARARVLRGRSALELAALALAGGVTIREHLAWFGEAGRTRATLKGDEVIALGIPAGPDVAAVLEALRDARLDGDVRERGDEEAFVRRWTRDDSDGRSVRKER